MWIYTAHCDTKPPMHCLH